jgi:hypothetical protein
MSIREKLVSSELVARVESLMAVRHKMDEHTIKTLNIVHDDAVKAVEEFDAALRDAFMYAMIDVNSATEIAAKVKWRNYYNDKILPKKT